MQDNVISQTKVASKQKVACVQGPMFWGLMMWGPNVCRVPLFGVQFCLGSHCVSLGFTWYHVVSHGIIGFKKFPSFCSDKMIFELDFKMICI